MYINILFFIYIKTSALLPIRIKADKNLMLEIIEIFKTIYITYESVSCHN